MTTTQNRPTRITPPLSPPDAREIVAPPALVDDATTTPFQFLLPVVGAMTSVIMMVVLRNGQPLFMVLAAVIFVVAIVMGLGFALSSRGRASKKLRLQRTRYLDYLEKVRTSLQEEAQEARSQSALLHPAPDGLTTLVLDPERVWERRASDPDHLDARIGVGNVPWFSLHVPNPETPTEPADPILQQEAERLAGQLSSVEAMAQLVHLRSAGTVAVIGDEAATASTARTLLMQLAAHQTPEDVQLALVHDLGREDRWQGFDLLPHAHDSKLFDGPVPARRVAPTMRELSQVLGANLVSRTETAAMARRRGIAAAHPSRLVIVVDGHGHDAESLLLPDASMSARELGITVIYLLDDRLQEPDDVDVRVTLGDEPTIAEAASGGEFASRAFVPDAMASWQFASLARTLASRRTFDVVIDDRTSDEQATVEELLGLEAARSAGGAQITVPGWAPRPPSDFLRVAFGVDDFGAPVYLDLKESAQQGMGPHGICIGATGSGKSEMLRTLITSLAVQHSPEDLAMILVDYKGGAAFSPFAKLPHLAGLIDNLADDPQLTVRARASLQSEVVRRQQLLKSADSSPSITHYRQLRKTRSDLAPMPHLFVVIDEFAELLTAEPDFIDLFLQIGRIGRSIGVHLLLSSQRIEAGKLRGLDTYLSYRLGLRTFSEAESQVVLSTKDAFQLPPLPGYGYLKVDTSVYQRFRAGYVSGEVALPTQPTTVEAGPRVFRVPTFNGIAAAESETPETPVLREPDVGPSLVDEVVAQLQARAQSVSPVWLEPLPSRVAVGELVADQENSEAEFAVTLGVMDDPARQRQDVWRIDLTRSGGYAAIIGAPGSGRTTALRTVAASIALQYTPSEVGIYGMDLSGSGLRRLEGLPHVGGVAVRGDSDRLQRLIEELTMMLRRREEVFKARGIESVSHLRRLHAAGEVPELTSADIVVLVDGYGALRADYDKFEEQFVHLMTQGASYGLHFVLGLGRWSELRIAHQSLFANRIELRLNDPGDSINDRKLAKTIDAATPGRALTDSGLLAQFALPALSILDEGEVGDALDALVEAVASSWSGSKAAPIRLLPTNLDPASLPDAVDEPAVVPLGLRQDTMSSAFWDFTDADQHLLVFGDADQHLLVFGDAKCGKSTVLRTIAHGLVERFTPGELAIAVVDARGHVPTVIPDEYLAAHARSASQAAGMASSIAKELEQRAGMSEADRRKSPRIVLLIDDLDIVAAGGLEPFQALMPHLPGARDLAFHVVLTRPVAGAARAMFNQFVQGVRDTGGAMLIMSGDRGEGQLLPRVYAERMPPGRGKYARRGETPHVIQVANVGGA